MKSRLGGLALLALVGVSLASPQYRLPAVVQPPSMAKRAIAKSATPLPGREIDLYGDGKYTLFIPDSWKRSDRIPLTVHFHGASWFAIEEHLRRRLNEPLVAIYVGEGSSVYRNAFQDPDAWPRLLSHVLAHVDPLDSATIERVDVTSFSAGYGAVRELLKQSDPPKLIRRIVLADSMYASFTSETDKTPLKEQIDPYVEFAKAAMRGEKGFVVSCSEVPTETYANSSACMKALLKALDLSLKPPLWTKEGVDQLYPDYPLLGSVSKGKFHAWSYAGTDAQAHMTHPRHIADIWKAAFEGKD